MSCIQTICDYVAIAYHYLKEQRLRPQINTLETQAKTRYKACEEVNKKIKAITDLSAAISMGLKADCFEAKDPQMVELLKKANSVGMSLDPKKVTYTKPEAEELMNRFDQILLDLEKNQKLLMLAMHDSLFQRNELWQERMQHKKAIDAIYRSRLTDQSSQ